MTDTQKTQPTMSRSRINLYTVIQAHEDASAEDLMGCMLTFEEEVSEYLKEASEIVRNGKDFELLKDLLKKTIQQSIIMGAKDLTTQSRELTAAIDSRNDKKIRAKLYSWMTIAEETRTANIALFQACFLFGHALNGKELPHLSDGGE